MIDPVPTFNRGLQKVANSRDIVFSEAFKETSLNNDVELREIWLALKRRKRIVASVAIVVIILTAVIAFYQRAFNPVFRGSFALLITDPISDNSGKRTSKAADGTLFQQLAINTTNNNIPTLIEVLQSPLLLSPIAKKFNINENLLASRISITTGGVTRKEADGVLKVSLTSRNPQADQPLLESISNTYLEASLKQRQQRVTGGINFLNKQAPSLQAKVDAVQLELADFRRKHSLLEPSVEGAALKQREAELAGQILLLDAERSRLERVRKEISNGSLSARGFQEAISTGGALIGRNQGLAVSDADQSLLQQLIQVETELAQASSTYQPSSSIVQSLQARLDQLQPLLRSHQIEAVDAALSLNEGRLTTARQQETALNQEFLEKPALIKQYEALQSRLTLAQENLAGLVRARETFQLESAQQSVPWQVIDPPEINLNPIKPSLPRYLAFGMLFGVVAGAAVGLLRDRLDHVFHNPYEVKEGLGLPLIGNVPHVQFFEGVRGDNRFLLQELDNSYLQDNASSERSRKDRYQRLLYQEAFRNLFTSIRFLNSDKPLRTIAITSSLLGEGKSLVNVLLAKTLSEMGQRVLLVDADLRKPQIHSRLGLNNLSGLTNLLTDEGQNWKSVMQNVPGYDDWNVITAGCRPPDPARLLSSMRMQNLVREIADSDYFDLILFDTPPILGLADTALVAEHCDGLMLLVSLDLVDRGLPKEAASRIASSGAPLLGVVTNAIKQETDFSANGYSYANSYNYVDHNNIDYGNLAKEKNNLRDKPESKRLSSSIFVSPVRKLLRWIDSQ